MVIENEGPGEHEPNTTLKEEPPMNELNKSGGLPQEADDGEITGEGSPTGVLNCLPPANRTEVSDAAVTATVASCSNAAGK